MSESRGPLKSKDLARALDIPAEDYRAFKRLLLEMQKKGTIYRVRSHRYAVSGSLDLVTGPISMTRDGHGFVRADDGGTDVYVPMHRLATALDGDTVRKVKVAIGRASLASQAVGPLLSEVEMSFRGRTFPDVGKKMFTLQPLGRQVVHPTDSVLAPYTGSTRIGLSNTWGMSGPYASIVVEAADED